MNLFFSLFLGTFVLEDVALASACVLVGEGKISFAAAFAACFLGISIGDLGLYVIGFFASALGFEKWLQSSRRFHSSLMKMRNSQVLAFSILISRAIPGTRLPTYLAAGFLRFSFLRFLFLTVVSVLIWVGFALVLGDSLGLIFKDHWILSVLTFLICFRFLQSLIPRLADPWERKALKSSVAKWFYFEFWPAWLFYLPIVPYYIYFSLRYRSFFPPFYASPHLAHGGLIGESKWEFLRHLHSSDPSTLKSVKVSREIDFHQMSELLHVEGFSYPFIIKPDVGQRGFGVRIIRQPVDLQQYLEQGDFDRIIQRLSLFQNEAGLFYIRRPSEAKGFIFSITDKKFPFVIGDGETKLGDLILRDSRAYLIASVYFARLKEQLDSVPSLRQIVMLSECGNHCQGAIFLNGQNLISEELTREIDRLAKQIPDFYFGRFDVRYQSPELLKKGQGFEIVEVNGAGSEATHIWDAKTKLREAYGVLFRQWGLLFAIGDEMKKRPGPKTKVRIFSFLKEVARVVLRKESLSVSS